MKLLQELYLINSPSSQEGVMSKFVQNQLIEIGITDFQVLENQIYRITKDTPIIVAHMDHIAFPTPLTKLKYDTEKKIISGNGTLGADDKNGVWILLNILKEFKEVSFIFSTDEERGGDIDEIFMVLDKELLNTIKYCIVFDRRNGSDIIGLKNNYCNKDLEDDIVNVGEKFGYKSSFGFWSDCNLIRKYIPCVNLSCGYYNAHTIQDYTSIPELYNSLAFGQEILKSLNKIYEKTIIPVLKSSVTKRYNENKYWDDKSKGMYKWFDDYNSEKYEGFEEFFYCSYCGEHYSKEDQMILDECPLCNTTDTEIIGYYTPSYDANDGNIIEYYYCAHCDSYTDLDDSIIGLEDSPGICRQCGNVKHHFRELEDRVYNEYCADCSNFPSLQCDDVKCKGCPYLNI